MTFPLDPGDMRANTFGPPSFETALARIEPDAEVLFAVLLFVSASDPQGVGRDEVASMLWPSSPPEHARHSLRQALYRLRQLGVPIHLHGGFVRIEEDDTEIDLRDLLHGSIDRRELIRIGTQPFLPAYAPSIPGRFQGWLEELRDRASWVRRRALTEAIVEARSQARFAEIHKLGRSLLELDPLNETATLAVAEALVMDGSKVEALELLDAYEVEVGSRSEALRIPVKTLRRRVSEQLDASLLPARFEIPFVGREAEFRELRECVALTRRRVGHCVVITGEPGIGKTRIATELLRLAVLDGAQVVTYTCGAGDSLAPLSSLLGLTGMLLSQPGALGCGQEHLAYLRRLLNPDPAQPLASGLTAELAYAQLVYSLSELVSAITDEAPVLVFIDDAQRLHETSWRIFTDVTHRLPDRRVLLLLASRGLPEWYPTLGITNSDGRARHLRLRPFPTEDSQAFLAKWSTRNTVALGEAESERFIEVAAGNPFYLSELAAHRARGGLVEEPPPTIRGLIELQFAGLREHAQRVLLALSLLEAHATLDRVMQVLELTPLQFLTALDELEQAGLVSSVGTTLRLKHGMVAEVTQGYSMPGVLTYLQTRVAELLEKDASAHPDAELLITAVSLWERASCLPRAADAACALGRTLMSSGLYADASRAFAKALALYPHPDIQRQAVPGRARALYRSCDWRALLATDDRAMSLPPDYATELWLYSAEAAYWTHGSLPEPARLSSIMRERSLSSSLRCNAIQLALTVWDNSARQWPLPCPLDDLSQLLEESPKEDSLDAELILGTLLRDRRRVDAAASSLLTIATHHPPAVRARSIRFIGMAKMRLGEARAAREMYDSSLTVSRTRALHLHIGATLSMLSRVNAHLGDMAGIAQVLTVAKELRDLAALDAGVARHLINSLAPAAWLLAERTVATEAFQLFRAELAQGLRQADPPSSAMVECLLIQGSDEPPSSELLEYLEKGSDHLFSTGSIDHVAIAATCVLAKHSSLSHASTFLARYCERLRAESTPMHRDHLQRLPEPLRSVPA